MCFLSVHFAFVIQGERGRRGRSKPGQKGAPGTPGLKGESVRVKDKLIFPNKQLSLSMLAFLTQWVF